MTIDGKIRDEKIQNDINKKAAKTSAVSSSKTDKYEYLTDKEILPSNQSRAIEQAKLISFKKNFWKANKNKCKSRRKAKKTPEEYGKHLVDLTQIKNMIIIMEGDNF